MTSPPSGLVRSTVGLPCGQIGNALRIGRSCAHTHLLSGMVSATERRNHSSIPLAAGVASRFRDCADKGPIRPTSASATGVLRPGGDDDESMYHGLDLFDQRVVRSYGEGYDSFHRLLASPVLVDAA